jgi:endonuclease/exonuclease/phosphatase family metal-dependent hydrolase
LLAIQEATSQNTTTQLVVDALNGIYETTTYARGDVNGRSTGGGTMGVIYNTASLTLLEEVSIATGSGSPRNAMRYLFQPVAATQSDIFYVYVSHFKAGTTSGDAATRAQEAAAIRADADLLGAGTSIIYLGDFNVYTSSEAAYQTLLGSGGGQAIDPINRPGSWNKNNNFRDVFTQAPTVSGGDGLVGGGLNDRFDFQLVTDAVLNGTGLTYTPDTYRAFGNNGSVSVSGAINSGSNTALAGMPNRLDVLNALATASDHLPVVADYSVPTAVGLTPLATTQGTASAAQSFTVKARSLSGNLSVAAPAGFEISTSADSGFSADPLTLTSTLGSVNATVYIRLAAGTADGFYDGDITISGGGAATSTLVMPTSTVTGTSSATIETSGTLAGVTTTYGTVSGTTQITVTGSNLTGDITATAPVGFEVSANGTTFAPTATFTPANGSVSGTLFARLAATTNAGSYGGTIDFSSLGATGVTASLPSSTVSPKALTVRADNKTRDVNTANPALSASIMGFVNGDTAATALTGSPTLSTTAEPGSPAGSYPITVTAGSLAATNGNYTFTTLVEGTLTVTNTPVKVTGVFVKGTTAGLVTGWAAGYLALSPFTSAGGSQLGWQLPDGSAQLAAGSSISWNNVNTISVRFDQPISVPAASAVSIVGKVLTGYSGSTPIQSDATITPASVTLLDSGRVAEFVLPQALATGRYVLSIASTGITDSAGTTFLDGDWTTGESTFAAGSGNGTAGGIFNFAFNVLVGDLDGNGAANLGDQTALRNGIFSALGTATSASTFRLDINGNNRLNLADRTETRNSLLRSLGTSLASLTAAPTAYRFRAFVRTSRGIGSSENRSFQTASLPD